VGVKGFAEDGAARLCKFGTVIVGAIFWREDAWCLELRQQQDQLRREQDKMRRSMEAAEQRAKDEARRRDEYAKSLEAKFEQERQEYRRQVTY